MNRLKEIRKEFNLSQKELGQKIGKKANTICDIENDRYSINKTTAMAVEAALGINAEWLLTGSGGKYKKSDLLSQVLEKISKKGNMPVNRLKVIRIESNLTQKELANKIGRKQTTISAIENEVNPMEKITALAIEAVLGINAEWLLTGNGPKYKKSKDNL